MAAVRARIIGACARSLVLSLLVRSDVFLPFICFREQLLFLVSFASFPRETLGCIVDS